MIETVVVEEKVVVMESDEKICWGSQAYPNLRSEPIALYAWQMGEIKLRINVINYFLDQRGHALYPLPTVELIALQFRKILEQIAFASLVANRTAYEAAYKNFAKTWKADLLLKDLERVNPLFYPVPVRSVPSMRSTSGFDHVAVLDGYLTKNDFVEVYEKCSGILHALNPYRGKINILPFQQSFPIWRSKIMTLLNTHEVHLADQMRMWVINMQEDGDELVHYYEFERLDDTELHD